jgi:hypothetical protein
MSWRFWHLRNSRAGVLGAVLDAYEAVGAEGAMPFETWIDERYDSEAVAKAFAERPGRRG